MKSHSMKCFALIGVVLFLGMVVAPSVTSYNNIENELIEVPVEYIGLNERSKSVKITKEQALEVDRLFTVYKEKQSNQDIDEFLELLDGLYENGILEDINIDRMKNRYIRLMKISEMISKKIPNLNGIELNSNLFSILVGSLGGSTGFFNIIPPFLMIYYLFSPPHDNPLNDIIFGLLQTIIEFIIPFQILGLVSIGSTYSYQSSHFSPTAGWLTTIGLLGLRSWDGNLKGNCFDRESRWDGIGGESSNTFHIGIVGFSGLKISWVYIKENGLISYKSYVVGFSFLTRINEV